MKGLQTWECKREEFASGSFETLYRETKVNAVFLQADRNSLICQVITR